MPELKIPIAETFTSIQGEGGQSGIRMTFFRLAGCTVGRRYPTERYRDEDVNPKTLLLPILPDYVNECTTFDGRHFPCDTNYRQSEKATISDLISRIPAGISWVSITGGEPLMHMGEVVALCAVFRDLNLGYHIETSGTIAPHPSILDTGCYFVCSPKDKYIPHVVKNIADEVRLMVDKDFNLVKAAEMVADVRGTVWLSPLSLQDDINKTDPEAMAKCLDLMELPEFKDARVSIQIHKLLGVR